MLDIVGREITATTHEIADMVAGIPPTELGGCRLRTSLEELATRSLLRASITIGLDTDAGVNEETTLYYVCLEALTNAVKHAHAASVEIILARLQATVILTVRDDGAGGADPAGSGLRGLADRLAAFDGTLQSQAHLGPAPP